LTIWVGPKVKNKKCSYIITIFNEVIIQNILKIVGAYVGIKKKTPEKSDLILGDITQSIFIFFVPPGKWRCSSKKKVFAS